MTTDGEAVHPETGEVVSTSERAIAASDRADAARAASNGYGNDRLYAALMAAVTQMPVWITADKEAAHEVKYATLKAILETVRPILHQHGIRIRQGADRSWLMDEGGGMKGRLIPVYTDLVHAESGQIDRTIVEIPLSKMDAQAMGSAITYGRRYSLLAALGLAVDEADDDGESAKTVSIDDAHTDSADLSAMSREMHLIKDLMKLEDWARDPRQKRRYSAMSREEQGMLRQRKAAHVEALMSDEVVETKPKKSKSAE